MAEWVKYSVVPKHKDLSLDLWDRLEYLVDSTHLQFPHFYGEMGGVWHTHRGIVRPCLKQGRR